MIRLKQISDNLINKNISLVGWIKKIRKLGDKIFIDLVEGNEIFQIILDKETSILFDLKKQDLIKIEGEIVLRTSPNNDLKNGHLEMKGINLEIISKSKPLPFIIERETDALEQQRLKYRYLDLRRPNMQEIFKFRSKLNHLIRTFLIEQNFNEIETPAITIPTVGGSGQIITSSSVGEEYSYALAQSPQIYKQLLMIGQLDKYFQIVKCFRDEKARSDRQMEFTQLDLEMSFASSKDIKNLIEELIKLIFEKLLNINNLTFKNMSYWEAINNYGTDKPDLRFNLLIEDVTNIFENTEEKFIQNKLQTSKLRMIKANLIYPNSTLKKLKKEAESQNAILFWIFKKDNTITSSISSYPTSLEEKIQDGQTLFFSFDIGMKPSFLGWLRNELAFQNPDEFNLKTDDYQFLWVNNFPMFEVEDGKINSSHNPFTAPLKDEFFENINKFLDSNLENKDNHLDQNFLNQELFLSKSYDLVLNGTEIGGGSERIKDADQQKKIFEMLSLNETQIEKYFGFFLEALQYGTPPHAGIALGIDRIISLIFKTPSIRDVIAFPKTSHGRDEMTKGPFKNE